MVPSGENENVSSISRRCIRRILIRIKADVIDGVAFAARLFKSLRWSWCINNTMPMQDDYKASVTKNKEQTSG
jgi:hypothetical protein